MWLCVIWVAVNPVPQRLCQSCKTNPEDIRVQLRRTRTPTMMLAMDTVMGYLTSPFYKAGSTA